ncbi:hypothetical protein TNCV_3110401 [Trichonephila clavipes]|nr:hypothetical protein TNCV_3110401 [Trichonephila clavipes]
MIPFIKRFSYLHLKNLDDLQPDETEVKGIVPSPRYNLRARAGATETSRNITARVIERDTRGEIYYTFWKIPEGYELANMFTKVTKLAANLVAKNDANLVLPPRFCQVLIESPL